MVNAALLTFADLLRRHRLAAGLSQDALAVRAGLSRTGVSELERGLKRRPHQDTVERLADALGLEAHAHAHFLAAARERQRTFDPLEADQQAPLHASASASLSAARLRTPQTPLVGRRRELTLLGRHLTILENQEPQPLLLLAGEPGIGKSRLLAEAATLARAAGWRVLAGGCTRRSGQEPFDPFTGTLARALCAISLAQQRQELLGCGWLVRLLPELVETAVVPAPNWTLPPEQERRLMFAAVARYLANAAGPAGTLVLLDDLQWAGADALDLLGSLVHGATLPQAEAQSPQAPVRIVGAYRSTEVYGQHPLAALLADLARDGWVQQVQVGPLAEPEARELLTGLMLVDADEEPAPAAVVEGVVQRAGGVPYFLVSCAQRLRLAADGEPMAAALDVIPWDVGQSIRQRTAALGPIAQEMLRAAAVVGRVVSHTLLAAVMVGVGQSERELLGALDAANQARLLVTAERVGTARPGAAASYQFAHDLVREAILAELSAPRRVWLHRRVAQALEQAVERLPEAERPRHAAEIAEHWMQAGETSQALAYALRAGDQAAAVYANVEAERRFRTAVVLAGDLGDAACEAVALERLAAVLLRRARYREALATVEASLSAYRALGDVEGQARVAEGVPPACLALATPEVGLALLRSLLEDLPRRGLSSLGQARLSSALAGLLGRSAWLSAREEAASRLSEALAAAEHAVTLARAARHDGVLARAMLSWTQMLAWMDRVAEELDALEELLPLAEAAGDLQVLTTGLKDAQAGREIRGEFDLSQRLVERGLALGDRISDPRLIAHMWHNQAELAYYRGDWGLARGAIERSLEIVRAYELDASFLDAQRTSSQLYLAAGELGTADRLIADSLTIARERHDLQALRMAHSLIAERDLLRGRAEAVRADLEPLLDRPGLEEHQVLFVLPQFAWALLALGDEAAAGARALQTCQRTRAHHYHLWLVDGLRVLAQVRLRQERWEEGRALLEEAVALCQTMPYPYAEAKTLYVYGQLYAARGEPERAREQYEAALAICHRLGEGLYRPHIARALSELPPTQEPPASAS
jgi:transcriptional regulator with XRE-family HTH domain/tetratricopeptide (TPR) repeat protein